MWLVHVGIYIFIYMDMMNDGEWDVGVNFRIERQRAMTRRKMAFPSEEKKNEKAQIKLDDEREETSFFDLWAIITIQRQ